jgi:polar amino acid transport system substrate-binding protein
MVVLGALAAPASAATTPVPGGPLRVAADGPQPQFWVGTPPAVTGGFEYDFAKALATKLGYTGVQVVTVPFDALVSGKGKGYDLGLEQALVPKAKSTKVIFSTGYLDFDLGILVKKGATVPDVATARRLRWGVWSGPAPAASYLTQTLKVSPAPQTYSDLATAVTALVNGQIDAILDYTVSVQRQAATSGGKLTVIGQLKTSQRLGAVLPKGSGLATSLNAAIAALRADGTVGKLALQYLGGDPATIPFVK